MESNDMSRVVVPLTQGLVTHIDQVDADLVLKHRWHAVKQPCGLQYAARSVAIGKRRVRQYLHRFLLDPLSESPLVVDHINHDGLDNTRSNLRLVTQAENLRNRRYWSAPDRHVGIHVQGDGWLAKIYVDGRYVALGTYKTNEEAMAAYNGAHIALFGRGYIGRGVTQ